MRLLRNPEVGRPLLALLAAAGLSLALISVFLKGETYRVVVLTAVGGAFALCCAIFLTASYFHFRDVRDFTEEARRSLRGSRDLRFDEFREGDFSELQDVVKKMAFAHIKQEELLEKDKTILTDALAYISHQLKTPLQTLTLMGNQLMADDILTADRKRAARKILDTTARYSELVKTLLELSKLDAGAENFHMEDFTAERLIDRACETVEIVMELREIELVKNVPPQVMIHSDLKWLSQALMNIVKNCMEHTPAGGTVTIDVIDSATATDIVIRDTGPGISEEDLPHLFERFYKGRDSGPNSVGIGLAFTDQVVTALGGKVLQPENAPDGGAVFTVRLINKINV